MGYDRMGGVQDSSRSNNHHCPGLDETRVLIRPLSGDARAFLTFWTARFEISM